MKRFNMNEKAEVANAIVSGAHEEVQVGVGYSCNELYKLYKLGVKYGVKVSQCTQHLLVLTNPDDVNSITESLEPDTEYIVISKFELSEEQKNVLANLKSIKLLMMK
ncbi:hypothetical protein [Vibrio metschnikovii]|uniref:Uncharacterized protein n=1 Tax=Vibrio metschnikovii TaxID=28172 RepID=A0A9X0R7I0_VIBME|nr:hypothetical protein [Vibrio metschnikovii]MBC5851174.1 hypothetical protein [Vibrio metschnikovii]